MTWRHRACPGRAGQALALAARDPRLRTLSIAELNPTRCALTWCASALLAASPACTPSGSARFALPRVLPAMPLDQLQVIGVEEEHAIEVSLRGGPAYRFAS
jgi:hypothetical protein